MAAPGGPVGTLNATRYTLGTSNAAALGTREAYRFYELLESLRLQPEVDIPEDYDAVLMKTLLVHGAKWGEMFRPFEASLCTDQNRRAFRDYVVRFLGYGQPDFKRVVMGADQRVTVVGFGQLLDGEAAEFALPATAKPSRYQTEITGNYHIGLVLSDLQPKPKISRRPIFGMISRAEV